MNSSTLIVDFKGFVNRIGAPNAAPMPAFATADNRERLANGFRLLGCRLRTDYEPAFVPTLGILLNDRLLDPCRAELGFLELMESQLWFRWSRRSLCPGCQRPSQRSNKEFPIARSGRRTQFRRWRLPE